MRSSRSIGGVYDVAVLGGGIIGTAAAAFLAEAGASVVLIELSGLGAGASGRNSGAVQHPYDRVFASLHYDTLPLYRELADDDAEFSFPAVPDGLLLVTTDEAAASRAADEWALELAELGPEFISRAQMQRLEPTLDESVAACLLQTGYAVAPASATLAFARRAVRSGAVIRVGQAGTPLLEGSRAVGVQVGLETVGAGAVLVAGGPWSVDLVPGWGSRPPIRRTWGVVATVDLAEPPRRILEELTIDASGSAEDVAFSLMTAAGATSLGSTFLVAEPAPTELVQSLVDNGQRFVPGLASARVTATRVCARPVAFDGRPLIGAVPGVGGLFVCAGHGPWGISTGPASARLVVDAMLARQGPGIPGELAASRY